MRQAALQSVSLWRDHAALPQVVKLLRLCTMQNMRLSAEVLGRLGDKSMVPHLLEAAEEDGYKVVFIDTPPHTAPAIEIVARNIDLAIVPVQPSILDVAATRP